MCSYRRDVGLSMKFSFIIKKCALECYGVHADPYKCNGWSNQDKWTYSMVLIIIIIIIKGTYTIYRI
jgi:hypothetical protein